MHVAFGFDQNYTMPTGMVMLSICINTPGPICFHALIAPDVTDASRVLLEDLVNSYGKRIVFYTIDPMLLKGAHLNPRYTLCAYNRLLIPDILSPDIKKVIYLDSDTVTVDSLQPLWDVELADNEPLGLCYDSNSSDVRYLNSLDIPLSQTYCNTGVLLMNLDCWRREGIGRKCLDLLSTRDFPFVDQDVLNILLGDRFHHLHLRYNLQYQFLTEDEKDLMVEKAKYHPEVSEAVESPVVIHYSGHFKPWYTDCKFAEPWRKCKALSPWKDMPLIPRHTNEGFQLQVDGVIDNDIEAARSIAAPLIAIAMKLSIRRPRLFVLLRKMLWTLARKRHLIKD